LQISWTHALRQIVINCYKYHGREDLLPAFSEEDEKANAAAAANAGVTIGSGGTGTAGSGSSGGSNGGSGSGGSSSGATVGTVLKLHSHKLQTATQNPGAGGGGGAGGSITTAQLATTSPITATTAQVCRYTMERCCFFYCFILFFLKYYGSYLNGVDIQQQFTVLNSWSYSQTSIMSYLSRCT